MKLDALRPNRRLKRRDHKGGIEKKRDMKTLNFELMLLTKKNRDGSFSTQNARSRILALCANELHDLGYRRLSVQGLKSKHVDALVKHWIGRELSSGTIKNRMSHVRWWAEKVGKSGVVRSDNEAYGIVNRQYVTNTDKSKQLDSKLEAVRDEYTRLSLRLQQAFGLRREESIKFQPQFADRGDKLVLKETWTKGGKAREIPIKNDEQRQILREVHALAGKGALIPSNKNFVQQLKVYEDRVSKAGYSKMHGLRHGYAQQRYEELTGWKCSVQGGLRRHELDGVKREQDTAARMIISKELGHERLEVVAVYLGS